MFVDVKTSISTRTALNPPPLPSPDAARYSDAHLCGRDEIAEGNGWMEDCLSQTRKNSIKVLGRKVGAGGCASSIIPFRTTGSGPNLEADPDFGQLANKQETHKRHILSKQQRNPSALSLFGLVLGM